MTSTKSNLEARYGVSKSPRSRTLKRVGVAALATAFLATVFWVAWVFITGDSIKSATLGYEHVDSQSMNVRFSVNVAPGTAVTCGVEAFNANRGQVGFAVVVLPPQKERVTTHTATVITQGKAVSGAVKTCEITPK